MFSVLMSVYYKENPEWLKESINSILNQISMPSEIVMVKDGKLTDSLDGVIDTFVQQNSGLFQIIQLEENKGLGEALRIGLQNCHYEIVARMDSDDISKPDRFIKQLNLIENDDTLSIVGTMIDEFIDVPDNVVSSRILPTEYDDIVEFSKTRNPFNHPSVMFRKKDVEKCGGYLPFHLLEDYYLWVRMLNKGMKALNINESLLLMRINQDSIKRRGGLKYLKSYRKFKMEMYRINFITFPDLVKSMVVRTIVCLVPNKIRKWIYFRFARIKY